MPRIIKFSGGAHHRIPFINRAHRIIQTHFDMHVDHISGVPYALSELDPIRIGTLDPYVLPDRRDDLTT